MSLTGRAWLVPVSNKWGSVSVWCFSMPGVARIVLRLSEMYSTLPVDRASRLMRGRASAPAHSGFARLPQHRSLPIVTASCNNNNNELVEASAGLTGMDRRTLLRGALLGMMPALSSAPAQAAVVDEDRATSIYEAARQSVVAIVRLTKEASGAEVPSGQGTGIVWDSSYIVTNYHVISKLDKSQVAKVSVTDPQGKERLLDAQIVGTDTINDLAVLQVLDGAGDVMLQPAKFGTSKDLKVGQSVFAIGNPYGLGKTLSAGVVSGLNRAIPSPVGTRIYGCIQSDAQINAGNSGGPLFDSSGRVVGMNTATYTRSGTGRGSGVNFALPIDMVRDIVPKLIVYGNAMGKRV